MSGRGLLIPMPTTLVRAGALILGGGAVLLAANIVVPRGSEAKPIDNTDVRGGVTQAGSQTGSLPAYMGTMQGARYTIDVYMGPRGAEFTVKDLAGNLLAQGLTSEELQKRYPANEPLPQEMPSEYVEAPVEGETMAEEPVEEAPVVEPADEASEVPAPAREPLPPEA